MNDHALRLPLLLVAAALFANAAVQIIPPAYAGDRVDTRIDGAVELKDVRIGDFRDELVIERIRDDVTVKFDHGPGTSSSFPLYVKLVQ